MCLCTLHTRIFVLQSLITRTIAKEIFYFVNKFFDKHNLKCKHVIGVCIDGAPAMLGCRSGFQTLVKEKSPGVAGTHCTIHRQAFMAKTLPNQLKNVLDNVFKLYQSKCTQFSSICRIAQEK